MHCECIHNSDDNNRLYGHLGLVSIFLRADGSTMNVFPLQLSHLSIWGSIASWFLFLAVYSHMWPTFDLAPVMVGMVRIHTHTHATYIYHVQCTFVFKNTTPSSHNAMAAVVVHLVVLSDGVRKVSVYFINKCKFYQYTWITWCDIMP